ncbi:hypothetical protein JF634_06935 [Simonsiella muelleri]|uniref:Glycine zipper 2TM domain-containing protein n=1 Tax=Simonsiella muelleri ATCC 29453 TaxID=641147 RepID=V9HKC3_9NEIS|nr:hypothetical protein [Simonsiella muelleri]AUX62457.1 hypothetical protein BWP33_12055 [Simonsiella muelleri ATCC 29453]EFG30315.1 hypothetical protein HMPREF9021_01812 [Simonsiella muelleri ATCC 29453]UBQ52956.1 hypothetical protein JF634_06935 [Simonsiella muelleri]
MKTKIATVIAMAMLSAPVMAQQNLNSLDSQVFANQNIKAVELSQTEMKETQGEWVANAIGGVMGGVGGHFGYMAGAALAGSYNFNGHMAAIGTGAAVGVLSPVTGASTLVHGMRGAALAGVIGGINGYAGNTGKNHTFRR